MFIKFPSIEGLHNVTRNSSRLVNQYGATITYRGKIKLHGTNAAVRINADGSVFAQKRSANITLGDDNAGFAAWVDSNRDFFADSRESHDIVIFGEWAGKGIQSGVAVSNVDRAFFPFAVYVPDHDFMEVDTEELRIGSHPEINPLPWETNEVTFDFTDVANLRRVAEEINERIEIVEKVDPYILRTFGVEGVGEGLVYVPIMDNLTRDQYSALSFKAKGENHRVNKQKTAVQIDPTVAGNIRDFVENFATEPRFEQGLNEVGELVPQNIGPFVKWVAQDILKESKDELSVSGLEWKDVVKPINIKAVGWFKDKMNDF